MATKFVAMSLAALVLLSLMATTILAMEANDDLASAFLGMEVDASGGKGACCDQCPCTRSIPPQCRCADIKTKCHSACKQCVCTRSIPPQCRCTDITSFCYPRCTTENGEEMLN